MEIEILSCLELSHLVAGQNCCCWQRDGDSRRTWWHCTKNPRTRVPTLIWKWSPALPVCCAIDEDYCSQHATKNTNFSHRYIKYSGRDFLQQQSWTRRLITLIYLEFSVIIPTCSQSACYHEFFTWQCQAHASGLD